MTKEIEREIAEKLEAIIAKQDELIGECKNLILQIKNESFFPMNFGIIL